MSYTFSTSKLEIFETILRSIRKKIETSQEKYPIVGINGYDASGKTHMSREFQYFLEDSGYKTQIIHLDDFHNHLKLRRKGETENQAYIDNAFNLYLLSELLTKIKNQVEVRESYTLLDLDTDTYSIDKSYNLTSDTIVLVEGVLLFREPINEYFDLRVYLEVDAEVCLKRNQGRSDKNPEDVKKRFFRKYLQINNWYYQTYKPNHQADFVIDNNDFIHPKLIRSRAQ